MSYQQIGDALKSTQFLSRVNGTVIDLAAAIIAATQDSGSIQDDSSTDLTTLSCKNWCTNYLKDSVVATDKIIGGFLLLNSSIAADPFGGGAGDDAAMNWQLKHVLLTLVSMG